MNDTSILMMRDDVSDVGNASLSVCDLGGDKCLSTNIPMSGAILRYIGHSAHFGPDCL